MKTHAFTRVSYALSAVCPVGAAANDQDNPNDVDANLGEIHDNDPTRMGADIVVVQGTWVYDSAHEGWNEIHPIKHCQKVGTWGGNWSTLDPSPARWCDAIARVASELWAARAYSRIDRTRRGAAHRRTVPGRIPWLSTPAIRSDADGTRF